MLTSDEIRSHVFAMTEDGGYDKTEVDDFLLTVADEFAKLYGENKEVVRRLTVFARKIDEYKRNEDYMTETMLTAQKTAAQTIAGAEDVVAKMIEAAKSEGKNIINAAKEQARQTYTDRDQIVAEARTTADSILEQANSTLDQAVAEAEEKRAQILDEAEDQADDILADADERAGQILTEADKQAREKAAEAEARAAEIEKAAHDRADEIKAQAEAEAADKTREITEEAVRQTAAAKAMQQEAFELKKSVMTRRDALLSGAREQARVITDKANDYADGIVRRAKSETVSFLLKTQSDLNAKNDEAQEKTAAVNTAVAQHCDSVEAVRSASDAVYDKITAALEQALQSMNELPRVPAQERPAPIETAPITLCADRGALDEAVASHDVDAVLACFGLSAYASFEGTKAALAEGFSLDEPEEADDDFFEDFVSMEDADAPEAQTEPAQTETVLESVAFEHAAETPAEPEPELETPAEPEAETEPESPAEPEPETEPEIPAEPEPETEPEGPAEPETETEPEIPAEPEPETEPEIPAEPEPETEPEIPAEPETEPEPETAVEPEAPADDDFFDDDWDDFSAGDAPQAEEEAPVKVFKPAAEKPAAQDNAPDDDWDDFTMFPGADAPEADEPQADAPVDAAPAIDNTQRFIIADDEPAPAPEQEEPIPDEFAIDFSIFEEDPDRNKPKMPVSGKKTRGKKKKHKR